MRKNKQHRVQNRETNGWKHKLLFGVKNGRSQQGLFL